MRQEYLYIKNFGPVKRAEIEDIKQFMFLWVSQAVAKAQF